MKAVDVLTLCMTNYFVLKDKIIHFSKINICQVH